MGTWESILRGHWQITSSSQAGKPIYNLGGSLFRQTACVQAAIRMPIGLVMARVSLNVEGGHKRMTEETTDINQTTHAVWVGQIVWKLG